MRTAFSYLRFSTAKQSAGDSVPRQVADSKAWCERNKSKLDESLSLRDEGVSAFRGKHRENPDTNALAAFLAAVKAGRVPRGSYLIVESLDRLTREKIRPALTLLLNLIDAGIRVVQLKPVEAVYDEDVEPMQLMMAVMELNRGHSESAMKSDRVGKAWAAKKRRARDTKQITTRRLPGWLRYDDEAAAVVPDPVRSDVVRRIYTLSLDGHGVAAIAKQLNADGVPVFGRTTFKGKDVVWDQTTVSWILKTRAVLGEYQPKKYGAGRPTADGDPIPNYYPAVVGEDTYYAVQSAMRGRSRVARGRRGQHVNLFAGLLRDARDGGSITYFHRKRWSAGLVPINPRRNAKAVWASFPARVFEAAVLSQFREVTAESVWGRGDNAQKIEAIAGRVAEVDTLRAKWRAKMDNPNLVDTVAAKLTELNARYQELTAKLAELQQEAAAPLTEAWKSASSLADVLVADSSEEVRLRARVAIRRCVESVTCLFSGVTGRADRLASVTVAFNGSVAIRNYLIFYRPPHGNGRGKSTTGLWAVRSVKHPDDGLWPIANDDLRDPDQAACVAKSLADYPRDMLDRVLRDGKPLPA